MEETALEISQLKYFKAVAETGKIVTAANMMFVTPPAISTSISQLEKELGMPLFVRKANRLILNRQGEIFLSYVNSVLRNFRYARSDLLESLSEGPHHITIAVTSSNLWIDLITSFSLEYPNYTLTSTSMNVEDMVNGNFNSRYSFLLATTGDATPGYAEECNSLLLFNDYPVVMVPPSHPFASRESIGLEELQDHRIFWPRTNHNIYKDILHQFDKENLPVPTISTYSQLVCQSLVSQGVGIALTTAYAKNSSTIHLRYIPLRVSDCIWPQRLYWRKERELSDEELAFKDYIVEYYRSDTNKE